MNYFTLVQKIQNNSAEGYDHPLRDIPMWKWIRYGDFRPKTWDEAEALIRLIK